MINYTSEDWEKIVLERTGGGADVIIDSVGKETWGKALRALKPGGRLISFGATTGRTTEVDIRHVFWNQISSARSSWSPSPWPAVGDPPFGRGQAVSLSRNAGRRRSFSNSKSRASRAAMAASALPAG